MLLGKFELLLNSFGSSCFLYLLYGKIMVHRCL